MAAMSKRHIACDAVRLRVYFRKRHRLNNLGIDNTEHIQPILFCTFDIVECGIIPEAL